MKTSRRQLQIPRRQLQIPPSNGTGLPSGKKKGRKSKKGAKRTVEEIYLQAVALGLSEADASRLAGVDSSTTRRWRKEDEFCAAHDQSAREATLPLLRRTRKIALQCRDLPTALRALTWLLSRRVESFKTEVVLEHHVTQGPPSASYL